MPFLFALGLSIVSYLGQLGGLRPDAPPPMLGVTQHPVLDSLLSDSTFVPADTFGVPVDPTDRRMLLGWLNDGHYDSLSTLLAERWEWAEEDVRNESLLSNVYETFYSTSASLGPKLVAWRDAEPGSPEARLASAYYHYARASAEMDKPVSLWKRREARRRILAEAEAALDFAESANAIQPGHVIGNLIRLKSLRFSDGSKRETRRRVRNVVLTNETSFLIRDELLDLMHPRFGGSLEEMRDFAQASQAFAVQNPRMRLLLGRPFLEEALLRSDEKGVALDLLLRGTRYGVDHRVALAHAAVLHEHQDDVEALQWFGRARQLVPQWHGLIGQRGHVLMETGARVSDAALRERIFDEAARELALGALLGSPEWDVSRDLERLARLRAACRTDTLPCVVTD